MLVIDKGIREFVYRIGYTSSDIREGVVVGKRAGIRVGRCTANSTGKGMVRCGYGDGSPYKDVPETSTDTARIK